MPISEIDKHIKFLRNYSRKNHVIFKVTRKSIEVEILDAKYT